eukprot:TRINITY_DN231_c0_g2_i1.p1 TRINITY_DN231_c0_g2~~TRINITY_DN231_c0_g2_i1.p1  ORF type:complete len:417 (-),score=181.84 TRINITY_DN231_c0_g2_i1:53-1234(-)
MLKTSFFVSQTIRKTCIRTFTNKSIRRTALYEEHVKAGAKMVPFCGWEMPLQYPEGLLNSHLATRSKAGLFDVSHMAQIELSGKDRYDFIEKLVVGDIKELKIGQARLSLITNENGGIKDDTIILALENYIHVVVNAGCAEKDIEHFFNHLKQFKSAGKDISMKVLGDKSMLALQGPSAAKVLQRHVDINLANIPFMAGRNAKFANENILITRTGYTGEDGFEISFGSKAAAPIFKTLTSNEEVNLVGLGARDSLRLEAGLCLYGNDLNENITPVEASLVWTIGQRRRKEGGFLGDDVILKQLATGPTRKRVGLLVTKGIAREHSEILDTNGNQVGEVTSGTFSPILKQGIAMGYITTPNAVIGSQLQVKVRANLFPAIVTKMPFVPSNYYKI